MAQYKVTAIMSNGRKQTEIIEAYGSYESVEAEAECYFPGLDYIDSIEQIY